MQIVGLFPAYASITHAVSVIQLPHIQLLQGSPLKYVYHWPLVDLQKVRAVVTTVQ